MRPWLIASAHDMLALRPVPVFRCQEAARVRLDRKLQDLRMSSWRGVPGVRVSVRTSRPRQSTSVDPLQIRGGYRHLPTTSQQRCSGVGWSSRQVKHAHSSLIAHLGRFQSEMGSGPHTIDLDLTKLGGPDSKKDPGGTCLTPDQRWVQTLAPSRSTMESCIAQ